VLTVRQVAAELELSPDRVRRLIVVGRLRAHDVSPTDTPRYLIERKDLEAFLVASVVGAKAPREKPPAKPREPVQEAIDFMERSLSRRGQRQAG
jgi:excisionase family DNA binding protein